MQVKERILATAFSLFHQQGYHATGINQIIAEAKVAKASFYQHFKSKEDLCVAFLHKRHHFWFDALKQFSSKNDSPKGIVIASFDFLLFMNEKEQFRGCSFLNLVAATPIDNTTIIGIIQDHKNDLRNYFKQYIPNEALANHVYLLFESAIIESQLFKSQWPVITAQKIVTQLIQ